MQSDKKNLDETQKGNFEQKLLRSLKVHGFVFPESDDEVEELYKNCLAGKLSIPEKLKDPAWVFEHNENSNSKVIKLSSSAPKEIVQNLAQAAREGKELSDDILSKMEADRKAAEKERE